MNTHKKSAALQVKRRQLIWFTILSVTFLGLAFFRVHRRSIDIYPLSKEDSSPSLPSPPTLGASFGDGDIDRDMAMGRMSSYDSFKVGARISQLDLDRERLYFQKRSSNSHDQIRRRRRRLMRTVIDVAAEAVLL
ncbi:hypothetical protein BGZ76_000834 [Entomortierella beljakovae]|nr:hypothetical protein BGZ76_000834 [Entomortierella beljakovae]